LLTTIYKGNIKIMEEKEQKMMLGTRIPLELFADLLREINDSGQNKSEFVKEAIEEKLINDNKELMIAEIKYMEKKIEILKNKVNQFKEKKKQMSSLSPLEMEHLKKSKEILIKDPSFIKGRISLYKNTFNKHYRISEQEFWELLDKVE